MRPHLLLSEMVVCLVSILLVAVPSGGGAAFFGPSSVFSTFLPLRKYSLDRPGVTVEFWAQTACSDCDMVLFKVEEESLSLRLAAEKSPVWVVELFGRRVASFPASRIVPEEWFHLALVVQESESGLLVKLFLDGVALVPVYPRALFTVETRELLSTPDPPSLGENWTNCFASAGFLGNQVLPCAIPFEFRGELIQSCQDYFRVGSRPFRGADSQNSYGETASPLLLPGLDLWCPVVESYDKRDPTTRKMWGFCECTFMNNTSFLGLRGRLSDPVASTTFSSTSTVHLDYSLPLNHLFEASSPQEITFVDIREDQLLDPLFLEGESWEEMFSNSSQIGLAVHMSTFRPLYQSLSGFLGRFSGLEFRVILLLWDNDVLGLSPYTWFPVMKEDLTCVEMSRFLQDLVDREIVLSNAALDFQSSFRCGNSAHHYVLPSRGIFRGEFSVSHESSPLGSCPSSGSRLPAELLLDGDLQTSWVFHAKEAEEVFLAYTFSQPLLLEDLFRTYAIVCPSNHSLAPSQWRVEVLLSRRNSPASVASVEFQDYVVLDRRQNIVWSDGPSSVKFFSFDLPPSVEKIDQALVKQIRLVFSSSEPRYAQGISEFAFFNISVESSVDAQGLFQDGAVNASSWFATREMLQKPILNTTVLALDAATSKNTSAVFHFTRDEKKSYVTLFRALPRLEVEEGDTLPSLLESLQHSASVFRIGSIVPRSQVPSNELSTSFVGAIDELRIWAEAREETLIRSFRSASMQSISSHAFLMAAWSFEPSTIALAENLQNDTCLLPVLEPLVSTLPSYLHAITGVSGAAKPTDLPDETRSFAFLPFNAPLTDAPQYVELALGSSSVKVTFEAVLEPGTSYAFSVGDFPRYGVLEDLRWLDESSVPRDGLPHQIGSASYTVRGGDLGYDVFSFRAEPVEQEWQEPVPPVLREVWVSLKPTDEVYTPLPSSATLQADLPLVLDLTVYAKASGTSPMRINVQSVDPTVLLLFPHQQVPPNLDEKDLVQWSRECGKPLGKEASISTIPTDKRVQLLLVSPTDILEPRMTTLEFTASDGTRSFTFSVAVEIVPPLVSFHRPIAYSDTEWAHSWNIHASLHPTNGTVIAIDNGLDAARPKFPVVQTLPLFASLRTLKGETVSTREEPLLTLRPNRMVRYSPALSPCLLCSYRNDVDCMQAARYCVNRVVQEETFPGTDRLSLFVFETVKSRENLFFELELKEPLYIRAVQFLGLAYPESIVRLSAAPELLDAAQGPCELDATQREDGTILPCTSKTNWTILWDLSPSTQVPGEVACSEVSRPNASLLKDVGQHIFEPSICVHNTRFKVLRVELRSFGFSRWNALDDIRVQAVRSFAGTLGEGSEKRVYIHPDRGFFGVDYLTAWLRGCESEDDFLKLELEVPVPADLGNMTEGGDFFYPQEFRQWVPASQVSVESINCDVGFLLSDVLDRITSRSLVISWDSLVQVDLMEDGEWAENIFQASLHSWNGTVSQIALGNPLLTSDLSSQAAVFALRVRFTRLGFGEDFGFHLRLVFALDCPSGAGDSKITCSSTRAVLPGECQQVGLVRQCSCFEESILATSLVRRLVVGDACQYTMWETCNGRGLPTLDALGSVHCNCFEVEKFGGRFCSKRAAPVESRAQFLEEINEINAFLENLLPFVSLQVAELSEDRVGVVVSEVAPSVSSASRLLQATDQDQQQVLVSFSFESESDPTDTCFGHGTPTPNGDCLCDGFFEPPNCLSETRCRAGHYIATQRVNATQFVGVCSPCPVGHFCNGQTMKPCPYGTFAHEEGMEECRTSCPRDGAFMEWDPTAINNITCTRCPAGSFCDGKTATLCPSGHFAPQDGLTQCISCNTLGSAFFAEGLGNTVCSSCPPNSIRINTPGTSQKECICRQGFWNGIPHEPNRTGVACSVCPDNAVCPGNSNNADPLSKPPFVNTAPFPEVGFWGDPDFPVQFFECEDDVCVGGPNYTCLEGTKDVLCSVCADGYYSFGDCLKCPGGGGTSTDITFVVFCWTAVLIAWLIINKVSTEVRSLDIALLFAQVIALVQDFDLVWPDPVNVLNRPFEITDFEVDYFSPQCWFPWSYVHHFAFQFLLLFIYALFELVLVGFAWLNTRVRGTSSGGEGDSDTIVDSSDSSSVEDEKEVAMEATRHSNSVLLWKGLISYFAQLFHLPKTKSGYDSFKSKQIGLVLNFSMIVYPSLVIICLEPFKCFSLADGRTVMQAAPSVECWTRSHYLSLVTWALIGLVLFVIGIPAFLFYILHFLDSSDNKANSKYFERYGWIYRDFRPEVFQWECFLLFRRFSFGAILVLARGHPYIQATAGCVVIVFCLTVHVLHQPFISDRLNLLDEVCMFTTFLYIFLGVIFTAYNSEDEPPGSLAVRTSSALSWTLLIVTVGTLILAFVIFYRDSRDYVLVIKAEGKLLKRSLDQDVALVRTLRQQPQMRSMNEVATLLVKLDNEKRAAQEQKPQMGGSAKRGSLKLDGMVKRLALRSGFASRDIDAKGELELEDRDRREEEIGADLERGDQSNGQPDGSESSEDSKNDAWSSFRSLLSTFRAKRRDSSTEVSLFDKIDADGSGAISEEELVEFLSSQFGLEEASYKAQIRTLFGQYDVDQSGEIDRDEFGKMVEENAPDPGENKLKMALKSKYLIRWVESGVSVLETCLFFELDQAVSHVLETDNPVSIYSNSSHAKFFRKLATAMPCLLDWVCVAEHEDVIAFSRILKQVQDLVDFQGFPGVLSRVLVPAARPPLLYWMVNHAREKDRLTFKAVVSSVFRTSNKNFMLYQITRRYQTARRNDDENLLEVEPSRKKQRLNRHQKRDEAARVLQRFFRTYCTKPLNKDC